MAHADAADSCRPHKRFFRQKNIRLRDLCAFAWDFFTACNILENTNLTNCTNQSTRKSMLCRLWFLLIAYKLHESMREDNANVETSYYGVSWMIENIIREHEFHAEEQGDFCEFCGFCVQKYLTQTTQTGADFTPHGERRSTSPFCVFCGVCVRHFYYL